MLFSEPDNAERLRRATAERSRELIGLLVNSPCRQSARARATGKPLTEQRGIDGAPLFDAHRAPRMF